VSLLRVSASFSRTLVRRFVLLVCIALCIFCVSCFVHVHMCVCVCVCVCVLYFICWLLLVAVVVVEYMVDRIPF
jgi:hypothetical protein